MAWVLAARTLRLVMSSAGSTQQIEPEHLEIMVLASCEEQDLMPVFSSSPPSSRVCTLSILDCCADC